MNAIIPTERRATNTLPPLPFLWRESMVLLLLMSATPCLADVCSDSGVSIFRNSFEAAVPLLPTGNVYFVAPTGVNGAAGSALTPWRNLQYAADRVNPGDTVCVRAGSYNEVLTLTRSGSPAGGEIVFQAYPGETARIDGTGLVVPDDQWGLVTLLNVSHVAVRDFEIANFSTASTSVVPIGIYITGAGTGIRIVGNHVHDIRTTAAGCAANAFGLKVDGTSATASINQLTITGNELNDLVLGCSESLSLDGNVEFWSITDNLVHDTNNIGIGAIGFEGIAPDPAVDRARDGVISGNTVYNITSFGNSAYGNIYAANGIYVDGGTRIIVERNLVHHVDIGIEAASEHAGRNTSFVTVRNNVVHTNNSAGISIGGYDASVGGSDNCVIVNNTLFRNDASMTGSGEFQIQYHASANLFVGNIVYANAQGLLVNAFTGDTATPAGLDHNLYFADGIGRSWVWKGVTHTSLAGYRTTAGQDANALEANPLFVDPAIPTLRVSPQSPAVGAGSNLGPTVVGTIDFAGQPRLLGPGIDIGAWEQ